MMDRWVQLMNREKKNTTLGSPQTCKLRVYTNHNGTVTCVTNVGSLFFFSWSLCYNSLIARAYIGAAAAYNVWSGIVPANLPMFSRAGPTHETYSHRLLRLISSVRAKQTKIYNIHDKEQRTFQVSVACIILLVFFPFISPFEGEK